MDSFKNKRTMRLHNLTLVLLFISIMITGNAQDLQIAGGGTLMDWAHLKFYQESNEDLKKLNDPKRVVFMGNSITQQWSVFNKDFFSNNPFVNRGIGGQTSPQMLVRFKPDVVNLSPKSSRVQLAPTTATTQAEVALAILKERRLELVVENNRFWDLRRYYNDDAAFVKHINDQTDSGGNSFGVQASQDKIYIPIPQAEIDVNPNLVQNPGY